MLPPGRGTAELVSSGTPPERDRPGEEGGGCFRGLEHDIGRAVPKFSAILFLLISRASCRSCRACWAISSLATLEVMIKMASLQSMVFPFPSVSRPCNDTQRHEQRQHVPPDTAETRGERTRVPFFPRVELLVKGR